MGHHEASSPSYKDSAHKSNDYYSIIIMHIKNFVFWLIIYFNYMNSVTEQNTDDAGSLCDVIQNVTPQSKMASLSESLL